MTRPASDMTSSQTILVVEDDALVRAAIALLLRDAGYQVIEAADGREALLALRRDIPVHLLLTDIEMPGLTGLELADVAKRLRPTLKTLFTSGRSQSMSADAPFVAKPYKGRELIKKVRALIDGLTSG